MLQEHPHYIRSLEQKGILLINLEDLPEDVAMQIIELRYDEYLQVVAPTPLFICVQQVRRETVEGGRVVERKVVEDLKIMYRFLINTAEMHFRMYKNCNEKRGGRKKKEEEPVEAAEAGGGGKKRGGKKGGGGEGA
jgi:hypothetical protein